MVMDDDKLTDIKLPYVSPRITEKVKLKIDIQTSSLPGELTL
jgi:hypothetical protein